MSKKGREIIPERNDDNHFQRASVVERDLLTRVKLVGHRGGVVRDMILCCPLYCREHPCRTPRPARWEPFAE